MPQRNSELLLKVSEAVARERYHHYNQGAWGELIDPTVEEPNVCNTAFCVAGHALIEAGYKPVYEDERWTNDTTPDWRFVGFRKPRGRLLQTEDIPRTAQKLLGLEDVEAANLFDEDWTPKNNWKPATALRKLAEGAELKKVTHPDQYDPDRRSWFQVT